MATRLAYGTALVKLGKTNDRVISLDGDVKNSTFAIKFKVSWDRCCGRKKKPPPGAQTTVTKPISSDDACLCYNWLFFFSTQDAYPDRFIECFIAEQNLVGVAIGCETRRRTVPFVSTFAAFLSRAYDQIRMAAISQSNVNFCGSHAGVSIGESS